MTAINGPAILDLNTQYDLFDQQGAYRLFEAGNLLDPLKNLFGWLERIGYAVVSTRLHSVTMPDSMGPICTPKATGYQKLPFTMLPRHIELPMDCGTDLPVEGFQLAQQYIFDLPDANPFDSARLDRLLSETEASMWLVLGGPLETCVRMAVLGLLQRRQKVAVIKDCLGQKDPYEGELALRQVESKNIEWFTAAEVIDRFTRKPRSRKAGRLHRTFVHDGRMQPAYRSTASRTRAPAGRFRTH
jgi:Isochorismatase family